MGRLNTAEKSLFSNILPVLISGMRFIVIGSLLLAGIANAHMAIYHEAMYSLVIIYRLADTNDDN